MKDIYNKIDIKDVSYDEKLYFLLKDENIRNKVTKQYEILKKNNVHFTTIESSNFPYKIYDDTYVPFCICYSGNIILNRKNVYLYYEEYYTNYAKGILRYFSKILNSSNANPISKLEESTLINIMDIDSYIEYNEKNIRNLIIYQDKREVFYLIDFVIIIEARYDKEIALFTNNILDTGREIYVVPSNIFRKNSFFSNYLIKQGADIILNKNDLKYIVGKIC